MRDVSVREMTSERIGQVVDVHTAALPDSLNTGLGTRYLAAFFEWFTGDTESIALTVHVRGSADVVGYVVGAPVGYSKRLARDLASVSVISALTHPRVLVDRRFLRAAVKRVCAALPYFHESDAGLPLPSPTYSLVGIAVSRGVQNRGIGSALLDRFERAAETRGVRTLRLSVYRRNAIARSFYERHHWEPFDSAGTGTDVIRYWKAVD